MAPKTTCAIALSFFVLNVTGCGIGGPCGWGQELREEKYPLTAQIRSKGCVEKDSGDNYRLQGKWEFFHPNGQKEAEGAYKDGNIGGEKGNTGITRDGRDGKWLFWHKNGQKMQEGAYNNGKSEGLTTNWYENGKKQTEGNYTGVSNVAEI